MILLLRYKNSSKLSDPKFCLNLISTVNDIGIYNSSYCLNYKKTDDYL